MSSKSQNPWIVGRCCVGEPQIRLICLPQAGAGAGAFSAWRRHLPPGIELAPVVLPGRGTRENEPIPDGFDALAEALFAGLEPEFTMPYALFGHSFGAVLAYELARMAEDRGPRAPLATLVSGSRPPQVRIPMRSKSDDETLLAWLADNEGLPPELFEFPSFLDEILRTLRIDLEYAESYVVPDPLPLRCPLHVFGGVDDRLTLVAELPHWSRCASGGFSVDVLPGGHGFPYTDPVAMLAALQGRLPGLVSAGAPGARL